MLFYYFVRNSVSLDIMRVVAGTVNLTNLEDTASTHDVSKVLIHEKYDEEDSWNNDIALLKVRIQHKYLAYIKTVSYEN